MSNIPAKTSEPEVSLSLWTSGNHRWKGNIGSLIPKANVKGRVIGICWFTFREKSQEEVLLPVINKEIIIEIKKKIELIIVKRNR